MKSVLVRLLIALCLIHSFSAGAVDVGNLRYDLNDSNLTATVSGLVGGSGAASGSLDIPEYVEYIGKKYSVTAIGEDAFSGYSHFTGSLTIPNSVTAIGNNAFSGCSGFTGSLTIPNSVITIGNNAFSGCSHFTGSLIIPNSVTTIGDNAFSRCSRLSNNLIIGTSVVTIGKEAFSGCSGFSGNLSISESVTTIDDGAFDGCNHLSGNLTIPNSVILIGVRAFYGCSGFKGSLAIGNSVTTIGVGGFGGCSGFTGSLTIPESVTTIGSSAFSGCSGFTGCLTIGNSVVTIGVGGFGGCSGFTGSLTIPESVTTIGSSAFSGCSGFTGSLTIPESVTTIGSSAFSGCTGLTGSLTIPKSVTIIEGSTFYGCTGFTGSLIIPDAVTTIGDFAFGYCSGLTGGLTIPNSVITIGKDAFYGCRGFAGNLTIPNSVTTIGTEAFYGCTGFTGSLTVPNSVTEIGAYAFGGCNGFAGTLVMGESLQTVAGNAFYGCSGLTLLKSLNPIPPEMIRSNDGVFDLGVSFNLPLFVPDESVGKYKSSKGWKKFYTILGFGNNLVDKLIYKIIPGGGDDGGDVVKVVDGHPDQDGILIIPEEIVMDGKKYPVTEIGDEAFNARTDIKKLIIPISVVKIGDEAFSNCTKLHEVIAADDVKTLSCGDDAFKGVPIKTLYLGRNTTGKPFAGNSSLTDLTFGKMVSAIGSGDFAGCGSISNITVLNPVSPTLPDDGFEQSVYKIAKLSLPDEKIDDYKAAPGWKLFFYIRGIDEIMPVAVVIEVTDTELIEGQTTTVRAVMTPENVTDKTVTWGTSDPKVADVNASGLVTAVKPGMAIITATSKNGLIASCVVTVVEKTIEVTELTLNYEEVEIIEGISLQLTATVEPHDATDRTLIWRTSNPTIVTVSTNGLIKAVNPGKANITVTAANGLKAICEVTVVKKTIAVTALTLNVEEAEIVEASVLQLTATIEPRDATDRTVTWTSSDESVAVVNTSGLVTAVTPGIATITATAANGLSASCAVTVTTKSTGIYSIDSEGCKVRIEGGNIIAPEGSEVFDLTGRRVKPSGLHVGIYLIRTPDGKTVKIRL